MQFHFSQQPEPKVRGRGAGKCSPGGNYHPQSGASTPMQHALPERMPTEQQQPSSSRTRSTPAVSSSSIRNPPNSRQDIKQNAFTLDDGGGRAHQSTHSGFGQQAAPDHRDLRRELARVSPPRSSSSSGHINPPARGGRTSRDGERRRSRSSSPSAPSASAGPELQQVQRQVSSVEQQLARDEAQIATLASEIKKLKEQRQFEQQRHKENNGGGGVPRTASSGQHRGVRRSMSDGGRSGGFRGSSIDSPSESGGVSESTEGGSSNVDDGGVDTETLLILLATSKARLQLKEDEVLNQELLVHELRREVEQLKVRNSEQMFKIEEMEGNELKFKAINTDLSMKLTDSQSRHRKIQVDYEDTASMADEMARHIKHLAAQVEDQQEEIAQLRKMNRGRESSSSRNGHNEAAREDSQSYVSPSPQNRHNDTSENGGGGVPGGGISSQAERAKQRYLRQQEQRFLFQEGISWGEHQEEGSLGVSARGKVDLQQAVADRQKLKNSKESRLLAIGRGFGSKKRVDSGGPIASGTAVDVVVVDNDSDDLHSCVGHQGSGEKDSLDSDDDDLPGLHPHRQQPGGNGLHPLGGSPLGGSPLGLHPLGGSPSVVAAPHSSPPRAVPQSTEKVIAPASASPGPAAVRYDGRFPWGSTPGSTPLLGGGGSALQSANLEPQLYCSEHDGGGAIILQQQPFGENRRRHLRGGGQALAEFLRRNPTLHESAENVEIVRSMEVAEGPLSYHPHNGSGIVEAPSAVTPATLNPETFSEAEFKGMSLL